MRGEPVWELIWWRLWVDGVKIDKISGYTAGFHQRVRVNVRCCGKCLASIPLRLPSHAKMSPGPVASQQGLYHDDPVERKVGLGREGDVGPIWAGVCNHNLQCIIVESRYPRVGYTLLFQQTQQGMCVSFPIRLGFRVRMSSSLISSWSLSTLPASPCRLRRRMFHLVSKLSSQPALNLGSGSSRYCPKRPQKRIAIS